MVPLDENRLQQLKEAFNYAHDHTGQKALQNYEELCYWTNEITGLCRYGRMLIPVFTNNVDSTVALGLLTGKEIHTTGTEPMYKSFNIRAFWTGKDFERVAALYKSSDGFMILTEAFRIMFSVLKRVPASGNISLICGPIPKATGTYNVDLAMYKKTVVRAMDEKNPTFNLLPVQPLIQKAADLMNVDIASDTVFKKVYNPLLRLNNVQWVVCVTHNWQSSRFSKRIHGLAHARHLPIKYLPQDYYQS